MKTQTMNMENNKSNKIYKVIKNIKRIRLSLSLKRLQVLKPIMIEQIIKVKWSMLLHSIKKLWSRRATHYLETQIMNLEELHSRVSIKIIAEKALKQAEKEVNQRGKRNLLKKSKRLNKNLLRILKSIFMQWNKDINIPLTWHPPKQIFIMTTTILKIL